MKKRKKRMWWVLLWCIGIVAALWAIFFLFSFRRFPVTTGISFNQYHAVSLGLEWREVYTAMLDDLHPPILRIAAMWSEVEIAKDQFHFEHVDWMMDEAAKRGTKVLLVVGQKAPRWPECHIPLWVKEEANEKKREYLLRYVDRVVTRYRNHPALELWQVENEPFIPFKFGECEQFDKKAIYEELPLVKFLDPIHKIVVTDSGELSTWRKATRVGDIFGSTLYRVVRTPVIRSEYGVKWTYDWVPAGFFRLKSRFWGRGYQEFFIIELQAEPWFVDSTPLDTPLDVQEDTMNPERLKNHIEYSTRTGASRVYLWGVEWWYFMKVKHNDARYWEIVKEVKEKKIETEIH